jgi:elongation factor 2
MLNGGAIMYEPLQVIQIEAPADYMGEISKLIANKRGQLLDMQQEETIVTIKAKMPVAEMFGWSSDLRSATGGRGSSSLIDQMFEKLPTDLQPKIVGQIRERKGLKVGEDGVARG